MRVIRILPFVAVTLVAAGVMTGGAARLHAQEAVWVSMQYDTFVPDVITVAAGTTIVWSNDEGDPTDTHNAIAQFGQWKSSDMAPGETWSFTFTEPGEYPYYCDLHEGMYGTVFVQ